MNLKKIYLITFCTFQIFFNISQSAHAEIYKDHIKPSLKDGFDQTGLWILIGGGALAAALAPQDENHNQWVKDNIKISDSIIRFGDFFGTGVPGLIMAAAQYQHAPQYGQAHAEAIIYNGVSVAALKAAFNEKRPNGGNHSFPSGHVSTAFASATSLAYSYGYKWAIPSYTIATLVALQRVISDAHWVSDTIAGAAIGFFWGRATYKHELNILPLIEGEKVGLLWKASW